MPRDRRTCSIGIVHPYVHTCFKVLCATVICSHDETRHTSPRSSTLSLGSFGRVSLALKTILQGPMQPSKMKLGLGLDALVMCGLHVL